MRVFDTTKNWILMALMFVAISCTKAKIKNLNNDVSEGSWKITLFSEDGEDETALFQGFVFIFNKDGSAKATKGSITVSGSWFISKDNSNDEGEDIDFVLSFPETNDFDELNDDWDVLEYSSSKIRLKDVSGGNGGIDLLTFQKL